MSDYEHHRGKLKEIKKENGESIEALCERIVTDLGITELPEYYDSYKKYISSESDIYEVVNDIVYKVIEKEEVDSDGDIYNATRNEDGTISFETRFYNGGCCLPEALEDCISGMEEREKK